MTTLEIVVFAVVKDAFSEVLQVDTVCLTIKVDNVTILELWLVYRVGMVKTSPVLTARLKPV